MSWWSVIKNETSEYSPYDEKGRDDERRQDLKEWFNRQSESKQDELYAIANGRAAVINDMMAIDVAWLDEFRPEWREKNKKTMKERGSTVHQKNKPMIKNLDEDRWMDGRNPMDKRILRKLDDLFVYWGVGEKFSIDYDNAKKMADAFPQVDVTGKPDDFQMMWNGKTLGSMKELSAGRDEEFSSEGEYLGKSKLYALDPKLFALPYFGYRPETGIEDYAPVESRRAIRENRKETGFRG